MILRPEKSDLQWHDGCPPLVDLAALCGGRLAGDALERIEAHVSGCTRCLELVRGLRAEVAAIETEAGMMIVPAHVVELAMNLRDRDATPASVEVFVRSRAGRLWMTGARRGLAAAAMLAIVAGGYFIGQSLTISEIGKAPGEADTGGLTFGLLDAASLSSDDLGSAEDDGFGMLAMTLKEGQS